MIDKDPAKSNPYLVTIEDIELIARRRHEIHRHHASSRPLSENYEMVGLMCEREFALAAGLPLDLSIKPEGDGRVDFVTSIGTIDVKGARIPNNLLRETEKEHADILVLGKWTDGMTKAELLGWERDRAMVGMPTNYFGGHNILNHFKPAEMLKPMDELLKAIEGDRVFDDPRTEATIHQLRLIE